MKSICPHCGQEYPETPDEYLGMSSECLTCHQNFVIEKVRFCGECGTANAAQATQCRSCGKSLVPQMPQMPQITAQPAAMPQTVPGQPPVVRANNGSMLFVLAVIGVVFIAFVLIFLAAMLLPALNSSRGKARRISCTSNLKQIGTSLKQYAIDYDDRFPHLSGADGLEQLRKNDYLRDYGIYCCPSTKTTRGIGNVALTYGSGANVDYAFAGGMMDGSSALFGNAESAIASDIYSTSVSKTNGADRKDIPNHNDYGNILFHDAHVSGFSGAQWYSKENRGSSYLYPNRDL